MGEARTETAGAVAAATDRACALTEAWMKTLPEWGTHPRTPDGSVSGGRGPTLLSEADCVLHFARFLNEAGVRWEDMHLEASRVKSLFAATHPTFVQDHRWRVDLAVVSWQELTDAAPPLRDNSFQFDAFYEFALASSFWLHGSSYGHPLKMREKVAADVLKVSRYVELGLCHDAYMVVFEECDHGFDVAASELPPHVHLKLLQGWGAP